MLEDAYFELLKRIDPEEILRRFFKGKKVKRFKNAIAIGKAAIPMINAFYNLVRFEKGIAVSPFEGEVPENTEICISTHPEITEKSIYCGKRIIDFLKNAEKGIAILLSGGGSALIENPLDFLTLEDVAGASRFLIKSSLPIEEINFFRIHLSKIKGGGLLNFIKEEAECYVLCDVFNNRIDRVSSAPFLLVKRDFDLFVKKADEIDLWRFLGRDKREVFKKLRFEIANIIIPHYVVADNSKVVKIFSSILEREGLICNRFYNFVKEEAEKESGRLFTLVMDLLKGEHSAVVAGGEATVKVKGTGKGGRTLETGLRLIKRFLEEKVKPDIEFLFATTDGIDGNSDSAGIYVTHNVLKAILERETEESIDNYLKQSNSKAFFERYGCLIKTGCTGNNLLDIYAVSKIL